MKDIYAGLTMNRNAKYDCTYRGYQINVIDTNFEGVNWWACVDHGGCNIQYFYRKVDNVDLERRDQSIDTKPGMEVDMFVQACKDFIDPLADETEEFRKKPVTYRVVENFDGATVTVDGFDEEFKSENTSSAMFAARTYVKKYR